ncbi:outer membrane protein assembly factor BamB [Vreelandella aquamarina]|uniref:outer membrane protein assembly factor BamB n=1 Tax=Vreelandella aquamarina TaxID=77097 RepID=UPI00384C3132
MTAPSCQLQGSSRSRLPRVLRLALGASIVALLSGCASNSAPVYTPKELQAFDASAELEERWSTRVGNGLGRARYPIAPARDGNRLFAADAKGVVAAYSADSGERQWEVDLDTAISSALNAIAGELYLGTRNGEVLALDQEDGSVQWRSQASSEVLAAPQANQQMLVVQSTDGRITALNRSNGDQLWTHSSQLPALTLRGTGTPQTIEPVTFVGFSNGRLATLDNRNGQPLWEQQIATPSGRSDVERLVDLAGQPVITPDGRLFVTSYNDQVVALEALRGDVIWSRSLSSRHTPVLVGDLLFIATDDSHVVALTADNGQEVWRNTDLEGRWITAPAFADGHLVFGDYEGYLHLIDARDGELAARQEIDDAGISVRPVTDGSTIHVQADNGRLETLEVTQ